MAAAACALLGLNKRGSPVRSHCNGLGSEGQAAWAWLGRPSLQEIRSLKKGGQLGYSKVGQDGMLREGDGAGFNQLR